MNAPRNATSLPRGGRAVGIAAVIAVTAAAAYYATKRWRHTQAAIAQAQTRVTGRLPEAQLPPTPSRDAPPHSTAAAVLPRHVSVDSEVSEAVTRPVHHADGLETKTVEQLYTLARQHQIAGRSAMRKADLIHALRAVELP